MQKMKTNFNKSRTLLFHFEGNNKDSHFLMETKRKILIKLLGYQKYERANP